MTTLYNFRLVETWTQYSTTEEDGPGSLSNFGEDTQKNVLQSWEGEPESFGKTLLEKGVADLRESWGNEEFSYKLQVFKNGGWVTLGFVKPT